MEGKMMERRKSGKLTEVPKDIFKVIHNRRSIRHFTEKSLSDSTLRKILEAGIRAPFGAQLYSMVYTRDKEKMKKLRTIGIYPSTKVLILFFVDFRKLEKMIQERGYQYNYDDGMLLWVAIQDATLVAENVVLAADALGLGSVLLGAPPLKADLVSKVFDVPNRVFPVVALCLGYPDPSVKTNIRPRFPLKYIAFKDSYHDLSKSEIKECMRAMDEGYITQGYYMNILKKKIPLMKGKDEVSLNKYSWSEHISRKFSQGRSIKVEGLHTKESLFSIIRRYGFNLD